MASRIFWIDVPIEGRLAIMPCPLGGSRLDEDIKALRAQGVSGVVSLLTPQEESELELGGEKAACLAAGLSYRSFPIPDHSTAADGSAFATALRPVADDVANGAHVAIHCRAGIGRSSMAAAGALVLLGLDARLALEAIGRARGLSVPETDAQRAWVLGLAARSDQG